MHHTRRLSPANITSWSTDDPLPSLLIDRLQGGLTVTSPVPIARAAAFCAELVRIGVIVKAPRIGHEFRTKMILAGVAVNLPGGGQARPDGVLVLGQSGGRLTLKSTSYLQPNVMRALRTTLDYPLEAAPGEPNDLACHDPDIVPGFLLWQLVAVAAVIDALVADLTTAATAACPGIEVALLGNVWVRQAEFCRDYYFQRAVALVGDMAESPIPGAGHARQTWLGNKLSLSWHEGTKDAPERKVYPKRHDTVRTEIGLRSRGAVRHLLTSAGLEPADWSGLAGAGVAETLRRLGVAAAPLLDGIVEFAGEVMTVPPRAGTDFPVALTPLLRLVTPGQRPPGAGGRPQGPGVAVTARAALDGLIVHGRYDLRGVSSSDPVLQAFQEMAGAGVVRTSAALPRLFTITPAFEAARRALAGVCQWPDEAIEPPEVPDEGPD